MTHKSIPKKPPRWADRFLEFYCADDLIDEIQGDLYEAFLDRSEAVGSRRANWWFIWDVIRFFRPSSFKKINKNSNSYSMYKNYFLTSLRNFRRDRIYATVNLTGLVIGISSCLLIAIHIVEEVSYDNFHPDSDRLYRVPMDMYNAGKLTTKSAAVFAGVGPGLVADFPEVESSMTLSVSAFGSGVFSSDDANSQLTPIRQDKVVYATSDFFKFFGYSLLVGKKEDVLNAPFQAVISKKVATQYFGDSNPIGQTITRQGKETFVVSGLMDDMAAKSHMNYDIILSMSSFKYYEEALGDWGWSDFYSYVKLKDETSLIDFENKLSKYLDGIKKATFEQYDIRQELWLQPVKDIHLYSDLTWEMKVNGSAQNVYFLAIIAILILTIAWMNYVNLATARAAKRTKEVGVRKVLGAQKRQLVQQFLIEAFVYNFLAILLSIGITVISIPILNQSLGLQLSAESILLSELIYGLVLLLFFGTLGTGLYPAFVLTKLGSLPSLKHYTGRGKTGLRRILVVSQLVMSILLIVGTLTVVKQLDFMKGQSLGFKIDETLVIKGASAGKDFDDLINRTKILQNKLETISSVDNFSTISVVPGQENFNLSGYTSKHTVQNLKSCYYQIVSASYFDDFQIKFMAGRPFNSELVTDSRTLIINESAAKLLGFQSAKEAVGEMINPGKKSERRIIGVVNDFHQESLKKQIDPTVFYFDSEGDEGDYYLLRINGNDVQATLSEIEQTWDEVFPDNPLDYFFLDEFFNRQYKSEEQFNKVFTGFAGLAVFVACLGLFGMVSFTIEQSKKQIAVRKVMGATVQGIVLMLAKGYTGLLLMSLLLGFPLSFYVMEKWLQGFAYQSAIGVDIFVMAALVIFTIALATVSIRSFRAARNNPVDALRQE